MRARSVVLLWLLGPPDTRDDSGTRPLFGWDTGIAGSDCRYFYVNFGPVARTVVEWSDGGG